MRLSYLCESLDPTQLAAVASWVGIDPEELGKHVKEADPTPTQKYGSWILAQVKFRNIRLPEDGSRVKQVLTDFHRLKHLAEIDPDIHRYQKIHDLEKVVDPLVGREIKSKRQTDREVRQQGTEVHAESDKWLILRATTAEAAAALARNTKWCTSDPATAEEYLGLGLYVVFQKSDGKLIKYAQYDGQFDQMMDVRDEPIVVPSSLAVLMEPRNPTPESAYYYALKVIRGRWKPGEAEIASDPWTAYSYARNIIKGPWEPGEEAIASSKLAYIYARNVIKGPWEPGEEAIASDPQLAYNYTWNIIKGRWKPGEKAIASDPEQACYYALRVIKGPWKPGEKAIASSPRFAAKYAKRFLPPGSMV